MQTPTVTPHHSPKHTFPTLNSSPNVGMDGLKAYNGDMPPPLRIHVHQPSIPLESLPPSNQTQSTASGSSSSRPEKVVPNGSWAMELLKGYQSTQAGLNLQWSGWGAHPVVPPPRRQSHAGPSHQSHVDSSLPTPARQPGPAEPRTTPPPKGYSRKRSAAELSAAPKPKTSEDNQQRTAASANGDSADGDNGSERKQVIACYTCRARKLK